MIHRLTRTSYAAILIAFTFIAIVTASPTLRAADPPAADPKAGATDAKPAADVPPPDPNEATAKKLQKPIKIDFKDTPLREVFDSLRDSADIDLVVEWPRLAEIGLDPSRPVTLTLANPKPAEFVFQVLFRALGGRFEMNVDQGVVFISAVPKTQEGPPQMNLQTYDIADLIAKPAEAAVAKDVQTKQEAQAAQIVTLIQQIVEPESWKTNGGAGVIIVYRNRLFVRNTEAAQTAVGQFITVLRQKLPE